MSAWNAAPKMIRFDKSAQAGWFRKENFYRGIRVLLELQRDGSSAF